MGKLAEMVKRQKQYEEMTTKNILADKAKAKQDLAIKVSAEIEKTKKSLTKLRKAESIQVIPEVKEARKPEKVSSIPVIPAITTNQAKELKDRINKVIQSKVVKKETIPEQKEVKEERIISIRTNKPIFPELKKEEIYYNDLMTTKKGAIYLFHRINKEKVCTSIIKGLKEAISNKSLLDKGMEERIMDRFDSICLSAMKKADTKELNKVTKKEFTKEELIRYIQGKAKEIETILLNDFVLFDM